MKLHAFPSSATRTQVNMLLRDNARGKLSRMAMDFAIWRILTSYGVSRLHLSNCSVFLAGEIRTPRGCFPVTRVEARLVSTGDICPQCGSTGGYLDGDEEVVFACKSCGTVFKFCEEGRVSN